MADPSDFSDAYPINRLVGWPPASPPFRSSRVRVVKHLRPAYGEERAPAPPSRKPPPAEAARVSRRELYRMVYAMARTEVELGESPDEIRAGFREMARKYKRMVETITRAIDDALDGRKPRW